MMARGLKTVQPAKGGKKEVKFDKPQNIKATLKRLMSYMLAYRWQLPVVAVCVIISALSGKLGMLGGVSIKTVYSKVPAGKDPGACAG